ncbi:MAG: DUF2294 domain-containing protein [Calditrichia bacterium]|nr:DUF2294 domain-containing protein [Calditrichia bacterium]
MLDKTKGQLEADISTVITKFEKENLGRGPKEVRTFIIQDLILVRLKGILTPAEEKLISEVDGAQIVKQVRRRLIESSRSILENLIEEKINAKVITLHTDISTRTGERIIIFGMERDVEEGLKK